MLHRPSQVLILGVVLGCSFDQSGPAFDDGGTPAPDAPTMDASETLDGDSAPAPDASECPGEIHAKITVDGVSEPSQALEPYVHVLLGDTVTLSAVDSCATGGSLSYEWQISPINDTRESALPDLHSATITVFATEADQYNVSLTVRDGGGRSDAMTVFGFEVHEWQRLDGVPGNEIRGLAVGHDSLWIAAKNGAFRTSLVSPGLGFLDLNDGSVGDAIDDDLSAVYYDDDSDYAWFGRQPARSGLWRATANTAPTIVSDLDFDGLGALGAIAEVADIGAGETGVAVATNLGVTWAPDSATFGGKFQPGFAVHAVARGAGQAWAGGYDLYDLDQGGAQSDPYGLGGATDDEIRTLAVDTVHGELWIGNELDAVARVDNATGATIHVYHDENSGLPAGKIRDIALERTGRFAGDVWVATERGVSRFKRDRQVWVTMAAADGLSGRDNLLAVIVDEDGGRRAVYAGATGGLVYIRAP